MVKWCRDSTSCSRPAGGRGRIRAEGLTIVNPKTLMEHKNPALTALEVAGRDLLRYTQEFGLTPAAELNLAKPPRPDAGDRRSIRRLKGDHDKFLVPAGYRRRAAQFLLTLMEIGRIPAGANFHDQAIASWQYQGPCQLRVKPPRWFGNKVIGVSGPTYRCTSRICSLASPPVHRPATLTPRPPRRPTSTRG